MQSYTTMLQLSVCLKLQQCASVQWPVFAVLCLCVVVAALWLRLGLCCRAASVFQCPSQTQMPRATAAIASNVGSVDTKGLLAWLPTVAVYAFATDAGSNLLGRPGCVSSCSSQQVACASTPHKYSWCRCSMQSCRSRK